MNAPFSAIPPTLRRFIVPRQVLDDTRALLARPGIAGLEAAVLWLGSVLAPDEARVLFAFFPAQIAYQTRWGLAVEIPAEERTRIALTLPPGVFVLAKLHTHAGPAYHSLVDAANPYLNHEGAVAITVPYFAREPLGDLTGCSINVFRNRRWRALAASEIRQRFRIIDEAPS